MATPFWRLGFAASRREFDRASTADLEQAGLSQLGVDAVLEHDAIEAAATAPVIILVGGGIARPEEQGGLVGVAKRRDAAT